MNGIDALRKITAGLRAELARRLAGMAPDFEHQKRSDIPAVGNIPPKLKRPLTHIQKRLVFRQTLFGLCLVLVFLGLALPVQAVLDRIFDLPHAVRLLLLEIDALVLGVVSWFFFFKPRIAPPSLEWCALFFERQCHGTNSLVISGVQLAREGSEPMTAEIIDQAASKLRAIPPKKLVSLSPG